MHDDIDLRAALDTQGEIVDASFIISGSTKNCPPPPLPALSPQPAQADIIRYEAEIDLMVKRARAITIIQDDATNHLAAEYALSAKRVFNIVDGLEEYYKRPHLDYTAAVRSFAGKFKDPLQQIIKSMGRLQGDYRRIQENERAKKQAALEREHHELEARLKAESVAAAKKNEVYTPVPLPAPVVEPVAKVTRTSGGSSSQKKVIRVEAVDLDKVETKYLIRTVDERAVIESFKGGNRNFPGLTVWEDFDTRYRL
jgi:hypothetical protein